MKKLLFALFALCSAVCADITLDVCLNINNGDAIRKVITFDAITRSWRHDSTDMIIEGWVTDRGDYALLDCTISQRDEDDELETISSPRMKLTWNTVSELTIREDGNVVSLSVVAMRS